MLTNPSSAWATIPGSQWISSQANSNQGTNGDFIYQACFCLRDGFSNPSLKIDQRADDKADVFLNATLAQIKSSSPPAPILQGAVSSFSSSHNPDHLVYTGPFKIGENCLIVRVKNTGGGGAGLDLAGSITAAGPNGAGNGVLTPECCRPTGSICGMKWNDLNFDGVHQSSEPGLPGWTIQLSNGQTAVTDSSGHYCFADLAPGVYTVSENAQAGWFQKTPPAHGSYSVSVVAGVEANGNDFGNCDMKICKSDGSGTGDPHFTTVDGVHYSFQGAGEFVSLSDTGSLQIQTRQTPVATTSRPGPDPYDGLATCVSINTAVAARVGTHRVTFQPNLSGVPDPSGLQLRVDGVLTQLGANGLDLGSGGSVVASAGGGIRIDFPDGTILIVTPGWWIAQSKWHLNVSVLHTSALEGLMGSIAPGSWLPALPNGTSLGSMPASLHQRYVDLNQTFADAWRVTPATSLFDYAPGTSTATFTLSSWPNESLPCVIPKDPPAKPLDPRTAQNLCRAIIDKNSNADCVFDVTVTGEPGFAKTYALTQSTRTGSTTTTVNDDKNPTAAGEQVTFTATVARTAAGGNGVPTGTVQFVLDGSKAGAPVSLDKNGRATWKTSSLKVGNHQVIARYVPAKKSVFLAGSSVAKPHTVTAPVTISNLPMQGGDEKTPCPKLGVVFKRADAASVPYLGIMLPNLDQQCGSKGPGLLVATVKFLKCAPDPRGKGFGPNASADITCAK